MQKWKIGPTRVPKWGPKGVPKGGPKGLPKGGVEGSNQHAFCLSQQDPHSRAPQLNNGVDDGVDTGAEMASSKTRVGGNISFK